MALGTTSVFDVMETDDTNRRVASRRALALSHKRVEANLGRFLRAAQSEDEFLERLALVQDDFAGYITTACTEVGHDHPEHIAAALRDSYRLASGVEFEAPEGEDEEEEDENGKKKKKFPFDSAYHESRRPRMCPYHNEVVNASLGTGDPKAGYEAMAQHAWSTNHCQGSDYEGPSCKFKPEMVTQSFWDNRSQQAEERRQVIPQDDTPLQAADFEVPADEAPVSDSEPVDVGTEGMPSDSGEMPSEGLSEAPEAALEPIAASWKNFSHIGGVNMLDPLNAPGAQAQKPPVPQPGPLNGPGATPQAPNPLQGVDPNAQAGGALAPGVDPMMNQGLQPQPGQSPAQPPQQTQQQQMQQQLQQNRGLTSLMGAAGGQRTDAPLVRQTTERIAFGDPSVTRADGSPWPSEPGGQWPQDDQSWCQYYQDLDRRFGTNPDEQPLGHNYRCPVHGRKHQTQMDLSNSLTPEEAQQSLRPQAGAQDPGAQNDDAGRKVSCPECGGDGKTANNSECPKCKGKGKVPNFGDSLLDSLHGKVADANETGLGGPEPKMDKAKWTPQGYPEGAVEDSGRWPTKRKDILVPIIDRNRTEDELKEIGEKTTEQVDLPSESNDTPYATGGQDKGVGGTWHGDSGQANPVTSRTSATCRQCGKDMNPVDAMVGGAGDGKEPICQACARRNQKSVTGRTWPTGK